MISVVTWNMDYWKRSKDAYYCVAPYPPAPIPISRQKGTIENKASYREYCNQMGDKTLAIYLAGFPGPMKKLFMRKLYEYAQKYRPEISFLHWGDIDLGGFRIFRSLKDVVPILKPHLMDVETLMRHREQCQPLSKGYGKLLKGLLGDEGFEEFQEVLDVMLLDNIRLEQEGITTDH